jgi:hypothetical protein
MNDKDDYIFPVPLMDIAYIATVRLPFGLSKRDAEKICKVVMSLSHENAKQYKPRSQEGSDTSNVLD